MWILMVVFEMDLKSTSQKATLKEEIMMYFGSSVAGRHSGADFKIIN